MNPRSSRSPVSPLLLSLLAALAAEAIACRGPADDAAAAATTSQHLVGGVVDTAHPEALIMRYETSASRCSGALVAPNLYLTARHCTAVYTGKESPCAAADSTEGAVNLPEYAGDLDPQSFAFAASPTGPTLAHGAKVHSDGAPSSCGHDLVLIELDTSLAIAPARIRRTPVAVGEELTLVGWGFTDRSATVNADEAMTGRTSALFIGPGILRFQPFGDAQYAESSVFVADGEVAVEGLSTAGDSGGPAFDENGEIAAIVARGFGDPLTGPASFTTTAAHLALVDAALASASAAGAPSDPTAPGTGSAVGGPSSTSSDDDEADDDTAPTKRAPRASGPTTASGCATSTTPRTMTGSVAALACITALLAARRSRKSAMR
jgi:trypsin